MFDRFLNLIRGERALTKNAGPAPLHESHPWARYTQHCARQGFDGVFFVLSFDCDTPEDAEASLVLQDWLDSRGIPATYAVPGETLLEKAAQYRQLAARDVTFINHGYSRHAVRDKDGLYYAVTDYAELTSDEVARDILSGHESVVAVTGKPPKGFRAPHFGSFQEPEQLAVLYAVIKPLGYLFNSGTLPVRAWKDGPVIYTDHLVELPLVGSWADFSTIHDSWNYYYQNRCLTEDYANRLIETVDELIARDLPAVLNMYVDPAHVVDAVLFYRAIDHLLSCGARPLGLLELATRAQLEG